jgi:hypothetical protein
LMVCLVPYLGNLDMIHRIGRTLSLIVLPLKRLSEGICRDSRVTDRTSQAIVWFRLKDGTGFMEERHHIRIVHRCDSECFYCFLKIPAPVAFRRFYGLFKLFVDDM